jgi:hypothetical protein
MSARLPRFRLRWKIGRRTQKWGKIPTVLGASISGLNTVRIVGNLDTTRSATDHFRNGALSALSARSGPPGRYRALRRRCLHDLPAARRARLVMKGGKV